MSKYWSKSGNEEHKKIVEDAQKAEFESKMAKYWEKKTEVPIAEEAKAK